MVQLKAEDSVTLQITNFDQYGFTINGKIKAIGPVIVFPKTIYSWNIAGCEEVNEKSLLLFKLIEPKLGEVSGKAYVIELD